MLDGEDKSLLGLARQETDLFFNLVESIETRVAEMDLRVNIKQEKECLTELTVYATALAMNYVTRGKFVQT